MVRKLSGSKTEANDKQNKSKTEANNKQKISKSEANVNDNVNVNDNDNDNVNNNVNNNGDSCVDGLNEIIEFYNNNVGQITPFGLEIIEDFYKEMGKDLVLFAMKISVEADKRNIKYIKAILNNWSKKKIKSLAEAEKECKNFKRVNEEKSNYSQREYNNLSNFYANVD